MKIQIRSSLMMVAAIATATLATGREVRADVVYQANGPQNNFVPFGEDGTPGRPVPGDQLGNTITLGGTSRSLDRITVNVAVNNAAGTPNPANDTWTLDLYLNDGPVNNVSGLAQPGTLIGTASTDVTMPPFSLPVVFNFGGLVVPDSFTAVISSTHPTDTFFQPAGLTGPFSSSTPPSVGSGPNTMWYSSASAGWEANSTWAIANGAGTNYFFMTVEAS